MSGKARQGEAGSAGSTGKRANSDATNDAAPPWHRRGTALGNLGDLGDTVLGSGDLTWSQLQTRGEGRGKSPVPGPARGPKPSRLAPRPALPAPFPGAHRKLGAASTPGGAERGKAGKSGTSGLAPPPQPDPIALLALSATGSTKWLFNGRESARPSQPCPALGAPAAAHQEQCVAASGCGPAGGGGSTRDGLFTHLDR